jgi:hypothetical protein
MKEINPAFRLTLICLSALSAREASCQTSVALFPVRDVPIGYHDNYDTENTNYNNAAHFSAFVQPGNNGGLNIGRSLIDFDLSTIPSEAPILGAYLSLSAIGPFGVGPVVSIGHVGSNACALQLITSPWNANTVTWNNQPETTPVGSASIQQSSYSLENYLYIDVTELIREIHASPGSSHGMMLNLQNEALGRGMAFHGSLASQVDKRPRLLVIYGDCEGSGIGFDENSIPDLGVKILPNLIRTGGSLLLDHPEMRNSVLDIELIDAIGRIVQTRTNIQLPYHYDLPYLSSGSYLVVLKAKGAPIDLGRLVVQ